MRAPAAVRVRGLTKRYPDGTLALAGIDLDVAPGECVALLGPNGAGKTSTIEVLEGHRSRDGGEVSVLDEDPARAGLTWRARLGIVLQEATDAADLSVREAVQHFSLYHLRSRDPDEVIALVGLEQAARQRIGTLSGGQRRRLDVALGILGRPDLLFLDEPTTGFDPEARRHFWELVRGVQAEGTTILLTTHYLDEAAALADRVVVIVDGRVVETATPSTLGGRLRCGATVRWTESGAERVRRTDRPGDLVRRLLARPELLVDGELPGLEVHRPTLEDAYLALVDGVGR